MVWMLYNCITIHPWVCSRQCNSRCPWLWASLCIPPRLILGTNPPSTNRGRRKPLFEGIPPFAPQPTVLAAVSSSFESSIGVLNVVLKGSILHLLFLFQPKQTASFLFAHNRTKFLFFLIFFPYSCTKTTTLYVASKFNRNTNDCT